MLPANNINKSLKWIVFDLGNVVIDIDLFRPIVYMEEKSGLSKEDIYSVFRDEFHLLENNDRPQSISELFQQGKITTEQFIKRAHEGLRGRLTPEEIKQAVMLVLKTERADTLELITELAKNYQIGCYSNTHALHWDTTLVNLKSFAYFQEKMASHLTGYAKPLDTAYQYIIERLQVKPEEILFVDDMPVNVAVAQRNGLHAVVFTKADDVRDYMNSL